MLGRSLVDVTFSEMANPYAHAMGVVRCAQGAEILLKARIAEEHPLLIFSRFPKAKPKTLLDIRSLMAEGRTLMYHELPHALWAATGYHVPQFEHFVEFGRLRNIINHLAVPRGDLAERTLRFTFEVMEPMLFDFWKCDVVKYYEAFDQENEFLLEQLRRLNILFARRGT